MLSALESASRDARDLLDALKKNTQDVGTDAALGEAKGNFSVMQTRLDTRAKWWFWASVGSVVVLIGVMICFIRDTSFIDNVQSAADTDQLNRAIAKSIYHAAIRITLLGVLGAVASFCMRIYRSHLHMSTHNQHRQQLVNNITFLTSAASNERQKDIVIHCLTQAVAAFGPSGFVRDRDDPTTPSKTVVDHFSTMLGNSQ